MTFCDQLRSAAEDVWDAQLSHPFVQGIGDGFIPDILDVSMVDDIVEVSDDDAIETTRALGHDHGLLVGISSGANIWAAREVARGLLNY